MNKKIIMPIVLLAVVAVLLIPGQSASGQSIAEAIKLNKVIDDLAALADTVRILKAEYSFHITDWVDIRDRVEVVEDKTSGNLILVQSMRNDVIAIQDTNRLDKHELNSKLSRQQQMISNLELQVEILYNYYLDTGGAELLQSGQDRLTSLGAKELSEGCNDNFVIQYYVVDGICIPFKIEGGEVVNASYSKYKDQVTFMILSSEGGTLGIYPWPHYIPIEPWTGEVANADDGSITRVTPYVGYDGKLTGYLSVPFPSTSTVLFVEIDMHRNE